MITCQTEILKQTIIHCHHGKSTNIFIVMFSTVIAYSKLSGINEPICKITKNDKHRWLNRSIENFETDLKRIFLMKIFLKF